MFYTRFKTELCEIILVADDSSLTNLYLNTGEGKKRFEIDPRWTRDDALFTDIVRQINEYIRGERTSFSVELSPAGTEFQKKVWTELMKIPYGEIRSYKDIALAIGNVNSSRAVGMANSKNPIPLIIPCHRVIGSSGKLTGYAHGVDFKKKLLDLEAHP
ncbi:MAG: cysteine methyltransferase [Spirochaetaceae bacterium 4572_59]|nr:MAG: cysteine methyltransferase [Spirochaetaceae bacterium 4572_59]